MNRSSVRFRQAAPAKAQVRAPFGVDGLGFLHALVAPFSHSFSHLAQSVAHSRSSIRSIATRFSSGSTWV